MISARLGNRSESAFRRAACCRKALIGVTERRVGFQFAIMKSRSASGGGSGRLDGGRLGVEGISRYDTSCVGRFKALEDSITEFGGERIWSSLSGVNDPPKSHASHGSKLEMLCRRSRQCCTVPETSKPFCKSRSRLRSPPRANRNFEMRSRDAFEFKQRSRRPIRQFKDQSPCKSNLNTVSVSVVRV